MLFKINSWWLLPEGIASTVCFSSQWDSIDGFTPPPGRGKQGKESCSKVQILNQGTCMHILLCIWGRTESICIFQRVGGVVKVFCHPSPSLVHPQSAGLGVSGCRTVAWPQIHLALRQLSWDVPSRQIESVGWSQMTYASEQTALAPLLHLIGHTREGLVYSTKRN